ncbi:murein hydrolase activator EnvC [Sphingosinicella sp. CPCC 101087]|uniref:murein hydrolase activator EnvC family protein n=1 Tax=Sphingosinicella sp. CPCC 101087 TaxID=2497754 RepID=UPI001FB1064B|nr:peptidoglycan DD-metalloendopeptidase family protein [Sphingosinicella sp. CPCC 101087]
MLRLPAFLLCAVLLVAGGLAAAAARGGDAATLAQAKREAAQANARYRALERQARRATSAAERAHAEAEALAARIQAAEADLTAAERRIAIVEGLRARQRARLAERQQPLVRLTAALQTMARRPAALALVQPGSVQDTVHVRSLLAATLPEIRRRTALLRAEVERSNALHRQFEQARSALADSRRALQQRRVALARFEAAERARSQQLSGLALAESDRALAFGEEARALARLQDQRQFQARLGASLAALPGPLPRPGSIGGGRPGTNLPYRLPVEGRLLTGVGEISDGGVHSRGLTFAVDPRARIVAPAAGRVAYAGRFRSYGHVVVLDHGRGWTSVVTDLAELDVAPGDQVRPGAPLGRAGASSPRVTVELRREGRPVPLAQLVAG